MTPSSLPVRAAGMLLVFGLGLAACAPPTPNLAAETPFVPSTVTPAPPPAATNTAVPPTEPPTTEAYPAVTNTVPAPPTSLPANYPATEDPYETGGATSTPAPTEPPAATATLEPVFIAYRDFEIVPAQSSAKPGQQVIFLIQSDSGAFHQPYAGASAPFIFEAPPNMGNGVSWPITFNNAQTLTILCGYHPNMTATLVIAP